MSLPVVLTATRLRAVVLGLGSVLDITGASTYRSMQRILPAPRPQTSVQTSYQRFARSAQAALRK